MGSEWQYWSYPKVRTHRPPKKERVNMGYPKSTNSMNEQTVPYVPPIKVTIEAEFAVQDASMLDISECVERAMDVLREQGEVKSAKMNVPSTVIDMKV
jgi:hypothetical protein